ncbi:MAG: DUF2442 domain-containing protein [Sulfuricurvum sp.]|uniref:DUF2442 domain-containing protein n=1 Tax=Sulfuricurvum sp. TaxID=2025608 RepID=UPI002733C21D|nr:DUF2442 domain-containing protein [Sulfuricurvum sp.]MDP3290750.1 DUF2442 domain-containing protein [Sulfuricurvum sp.]
MLLDIVDFDFLNEYKILLTFENGEKREFDCATLIDQKPFHVFEDKNYFKRAKIEYGTLVWPNEIDIAPETLYVCSTPYEKVS